MKMPKFTNVTNVSSGMVLEVKRGLGRDGYFSASVHIPKRLGRKQMAYCNDLVEKVFSRVTK